MPYTASWRADIIRPSGSAELYTKPDGVIKKINLSCQKTQVERRLDNGIFGAAGLKTAGFSLFEPLYQHDYGYKDYRNINRPACDGRQSQHISCLPGR